MITILMVCILLFKIKIQTLASTNNDYIVFRIDIFNEINVFYAKILIFNGSLYYKINNQIYKKMTIGNKKQGLEIPKLKVHSLNIYTTLNNEDYLWLLGGYGVLSSLLQLLPTIVKNKLIIKKYHTLTVPIFDKGENSVQITALIGFGLIKFVMELLKNMIKRRIKNGNTRLARQNNN